VPLRRELERVRQQVLQDLLETLRVGRQRARERLVDVDAEHQVLRLGHVMEHPLDAVAQ
jgi:hypothetical protein